MPNAEDFSDLSEVVSGRFRMRRLVAFGGMANIYEVEDLQTGRAGALKLLKARFRNVPDAVARLTREAACATQISDPHIVETYDAGHLANGEPFLFMELLNGEPLDRVIARRARLPVSESIEIVAQAAQGLAVAHAADILHRDIKPANLFLVAGPRTHVKLLDFGVSKLLGPGQNSMTKEGLALGTFSYMPPEQMMGAKRVDARADIYSLGVVLYQCLVGNPPFVAKSIPALSNMMAQNEYVRVSKLRPDAPAELDGILERSLRADPRERYSGVKEFRDDLLRVTRRTSSFVHRTVSIGDTPSGASQAPSASSVASQRTIDPLAGAPRAPASRGPASRTPASHGSASHEAVQPERARPMTRSTPGKQASVVETIVPRTRRQGPLG